MSDCCKKALQQPEYGDLLEPYSLACLRSVSSDIRTAQHDTLVAALRESVSRAPLDRRLGAVRALAKLADAGSAASAAAEPNLAVLKGDAVVIKAVAESLEDKKGDVRRAAIDALEEVAGRGNVVAIEAVTKFLEDKRQHVRHAAVDALAKTAEKGSAAAVAAVAERVEDASLFVRRAAVGALAQIAEEGNSLAIKAVTGRLEDGSLDVRNAAVDALPRIAPRGNAVWIKAVEPRLNVGINALVLEATGAQINYLDATFVGLF